MARPATWIELRNARQAFVGKGHDCFFAYRDLFWGRLTRDALADMGIDYDADLERQAGIIQSHSIEEMIQ